MRVPFNEVLKNAGFDITLEYNRLYRLFYEEKNTGLFNSPKNLTYKTTYDFFNNKDNFRLIKFRGTALDLKDFDEAHKLNYIFTQHTDDLEYLISFCEYIINLFNAFPDVNTDFRISEIAPVFISQIKQIIEFANYTSCEKDNCIIFIPKDVTVMAVSEIIDESVSYKVLLYNHHSLKGKIEEKKNIIKILADLLEPQRKQLKQINPSLESDLFNYFNNFNIRHNNKEPLAQNYNHIFDTITNNELEKLYDNVYQLCLLAFIELDNIERKRQIKEIVNKNTTN